MKITSLLYLTVLFFFSGSCKKFVEIDPPTTELVTASVFDNNSAATAAVTAIYSKMANNDESLGITVDNGLLSDELTNYYNTLLYINFYQNSMAASQAPGPWSNGYNYIYQANAIITGVQGNASLSRMVANQILGEAKFIRAFWLFYLTNLYGDIPLVTSADYTVNATIGKSPKVQVYQQIVADLKSAQLLLNTSYIDASDTTVTTKDRTRPTKWAASAMLARVYLYTGDYANAQLQADSIISNSALYSLCSNLNSVFLANSTETIWQLGIPVSSTYNTLDAYHLILISVPGSATNCCALSTQLLNAFEPGDNRRRNWVDSFKTTTAPLTTYFFPYKYKIRTQAVSATVPAAEDYMVLRLAEQYLIRAEAEAQQGNVSSAILDLNTIRTRAGLAVYSGGNDKQSVLKAILHERQVELFTEWGQRWFDLIRTNSVDSVMSVVESMKQGIWNNDGHQLLYPIPQTEINLDANLIQNVGY